MPTLSPSDKIEHAATDLIHALQNPSPTAPTCNLSPRHLNALRHLAKIFKLSLRKTQEPEHTAMTNNNTAASNTNDRPAALPRVHEPQPPTETPAPPPRVNQDTPPPRVDQPDLTSKANRFAPRPPTHRYPTRINNTRQFNNEALLALMIIASTTDAPFTPFKFKQRTVETPPVELYVNNVIDEDTGEQQSYEQLINNPKTRPTWIRSMCKE